MPSVYRMDSVSRWPIEILVMSPVSESLPEGLFGKIYRLASFCRSHKEFFFSMCPMPQSIHKSFGKCPMGGLKHCWSPLKDFNVLHF